MKSDEAEPQGVNFLISENNTNHSCQNEGYQYCLTAILSAQ